MTAEPDDYVPVSIEGGPVSVVTDADLAGMPPASGPVGFGTP